MRLNYEMLQSFIKPVKSFKSRFLFPVGSNRIPVATADIAWFSSDSGVTLAFTREGRKHVVEYPLEKLEQLLDPRLFFRISQGFLVSHDDAKKISPYFSGRLQLELQPQPVADVFVSRQRVYDFKQWMGE